MDNITLSMTEFMVKYGDETGWPRSKVLEMAEYEAKEGNDFTILLRNLHITVPKDSVANYAKAEEERVAAEIKRQEEEANITRRVNPPVKPPKI